MAVAATMGGASPNFDGVYAEITRLSKKLSVPSPREFNDPGQTLKLIKKATATEAPKEYETFIRSYTDKGSGNVRYKLYFKDELGQEQLLSDGNYINNTIFGTSTAQYTLNGQDILNNETLKIDTYSGRIIWNNNSFVATGGTISTFNIPASLLPMIQNGYTALINGTSVTITNITGTTATFTPTLGSAVDSTTKITVSLDQTLGVDNEIDDNDFDAIRTNAGNVTLGLLKLDATNGLDVGLINERVSGVNLVIEALNKVLIVAGSNLEKSIDLRI